MPQTRLSVRQATSDMTNDEELAQAISDHEANINAHSQYMLRAAQRLEVSVSGGPNQLNSIAAAVASINDASANKPYLITVGPGKFVEPTIQMKPYVFVVGTDPGATFIEALNPNDDLIAGCNDSAIAAVTLSGATGTNAAAIAFTDAPEDALNLGFFARHIRFGNNKTHVRCVSTGKTTSIFLMDCRIGSSFAYDKAFVALSSNGGKSRIIVRASTTNGVSSPLPSDFAYISGVGAELMLIACIFWGLATGPAGNGIHLRDGGLARLPGLHMRGFARGIWCENAGVAPTLLGHNVSLEGNLQDLVIDHPGTQGAFTGSADGAKVAIVDGAPISVFYADSEDNGVAIVGGLRIGENHNALTDVTELIRESSPYGVIEGGELTATAVARQVQVTSGYGYIADSLTGKLKKVNWATQTLIVPDNSNQYLFINASGILSNSGSRPDPTTSFEIGRVRTHGNAVVFVAPFKFESKHSASAIETFIRSALGPIYASGSIVTENATTARALDVSGGKYWYASMLIQPVGGTAISFRHFYHASGAWVEQAGDTQLSNTQFDNGTNLTNLTAAYFTKHVLFASGDGANETYGLVHGQAEYDHLLGAQEASLPIPPSFFGDTTVPLAAIIVQEGTSNIVQIIDLRPRIGFQSPSTTASDRHGDLLGLDQDDHIQYFRTDGTRKMLGNLDMDDRDLLNVGEINGLSVEAHASRHLPNGQDPLATAAASGLSPASANSEGVANSLSRSDHTHQITGFATPADVSNAIDAHVIAADPHSQYILKTAEDVLFDRPPNAAQPAMYGNNIVMWLPNTGSTTSISFGAPFLNQNNGSGSGQTTPMLSGTNAITQMKRAAFSTGGTNSGSAGVQTSVPVAWRGNKPYMGGFFFFARFGLEAYAANERLLIGLTTLNGDLNSQPSWLANTVALIKDSGDSTLQILCSNGTTATKIDTGVTPSVEQILDLTLYCKPNDSEIYARLVDGLTGTVYVDNLVLTATLPNPASFLYIQAQIQGTSGSISKLLSINRLYLETNT